MFKEYFILDASSAIPVHYSADNESETLYFSMFDTDGNDYYMGSQLNATELGTAYNYNITYGNFSDEFYWKYERASDIEEANELVSSYGAFPAQFEYLYVAWSDEDAWNEWHTINTPLINASSLAVSWDYYNEYTETYATVEFAEEEIDVRQVAVEYLYPYNKSGSSATFDLEQDYKYTSDLSILKVEAYGYNGSCTIFDSSVATFPVGGDYTQISMDLPVLLARYESIEVYLSFTAGANTSYTQFRLNSNAADAENHPEAANWTKDDTLWVEFEYTGYDFFFIMEDYKVGSEDSLFEPIEYIRNGEFASIYNDVYSLEMREYNKYVANLTEVDLEMQVLMVRDVNYDGEYENAVQKLDIAGTGDYNHLKFGSEENGKIVFHTMQLEAEDMGANQFYRSKTKSETKTFDIADLGGRAILDPGKVMDGFRQLAGPVDDWINDFNDLIGNENAGEDQIEHDTSIRGKRFLTTISTTISQSTMSSTVIQKDYDGDSVADEEALYTTSIENVQTNIIEIAETELYMNGEMDVWAELFKCGFGDATLRAEKEFSQDVSSKTMSITFITYNETDIKSIRYYEDAFPNELSDYNLASSHMQDVVRIFADDDLENDVSMTVPCLEAMLNSSHYRDNIPDSFETVIHVENGIETYNENILTTELSVSVPGYYPLDDTSIKGISVTPKDGKVYYDIDGNGNLGEQFGKYVFLDGNGDSILETVFILDRKDNVHSIGFDYDGDSVFNPSNFLIADNLHLNRKAENWGERLALFKQLGWAIGEWDVASPIRDIFSDAFYPLWKMEDGTIYSDAKEKSYDQFMEHINRPKEYLWEAAAFLAGCAIPVVGYFIVKTIQMLESIEEKKEYMKSMDFSYELSEEKISSRADNWFENNMLNSITGMYQGIFIPTGVMTEDTEYTGEIVLAPQGKDKTFLTLNRDLDYFLQTRSGLGLGYAATSLTKDKKRLEQYMQDDDNKNDSDAMYMFNAIDYLDYEVSDIEDKDYYTAFMNTRSIPTVPMLDREKAILPDFYRDRPIYLSKDEIDDLNEGETYFRICKVYKGGNELKLVPNSRQALLNNGIERSVIVYGYYAPAQINSAGGFYEIERLSKEYFKVEGSYAVINEVGKKRLEELMQNNEYGGITGLDWVILEFRIAKYKEINSEEELQIALMQSIDANLLEYAYQHQLGVRQGQLEGELRFTIEMVIFSLGLSTAAKITSAAITRQTAKKVAEKAGEKAIELSAKEILQGLGKILIKDFISELKDELLIDPFVEDVIEGIARKAGLNQQMQQTLSLVGTSIAESTIGTVYRGTHGSEWGSKKFKKWALKSGFDTNTKEGIAKAAFAYRHLAKDEAPFDAKEEVFLHCTSIALAMGLYSMSRNTMGSLNEEQEVAQLAKEKQDDIRKAFKELQSNSFRARIAKFEGTIFHNLPSGQWAAHSAELISRLFQEKFQVKIENVRRVRSRMGVAVVDVTVSRELDLSTFEVELIRK
ncbi:MAG: hypothetical protein ACTSR8_02520 [Promethearchaeota archaeon]